MGSSDGVEFISDEPLLDSHRKERSAPMTPYFEQNGIQLFCGDSRLVLAELEPDSLDSCVTDPPYELTSGGKGGFMGKHWDGTGIAFDPEFWKQVYRVLKPGAHLLAFGGTRTSHRMVCAIEDAGFEIRDSLQWLYGCLSSDSQILTNEGWKDYVQLVPGELVLGYDIETKKFTWQPVLETRVRAGVLEEGTTDLLRLSTERFTNVGRLARYASLRFPARTNPKRSGA